MNPPPRTPWRIKLLLALLGAVGGAVASIPLTWIGKIIAGAPPPATLSNYIWNICVFAVIGALFGPMLIWSAMRRVPLWRTIVEPGVAALAGVTIGMMLPEAIGAFFFLPLAGIGLAAWRLNWVYRDTGLVGAGDVDELLADNLPVANELKS